MDTSRSPERIVFFSDAVVAIAMTLLVLPLTAIVPELAAKHGKAIEAITQNQWQIYSFLLSFAVIARFWASHHRLFEQVKAYNRPLLALNLAWLLTIAVLPFPTEMIGAFGNDRFTPSFYIGTLLVSNACQLAMVLVVRGNPEVAKSPDSISDRWRMTMIGNTVATAVALLLSVLIPGVGYYALLLLLLTGVVARFFYPEHAAETA